ncbi:MAG: T9SS type A sorting domain-containing protein [Bacteroidales bacterium]|nr:T9SS type A sorting domain-containing protein [Bacteroidales bacterium]
MESESEEIKTGHVFIDGKYIEPPYIVKREGTQIFINNNLVFDYQRPTSPFDFKQKPIANFNELDQNSPLDDIFKVRDTAYNKPLVNVICSYYLEKYEYSVACDSIAEFYRSLPNVKSFTNYPSKVDAFEMISYNDESKPFSLQPFGRSYNNTYGPKSEFDLKQELDSRISYCFKDYSEDLHLNKILIFISAPELDAKFLRIRIRSTKAKDFCNILLSQDSQELKIDKLSNIVVDRASAIKIIETITDKSVIIKILEQTSSTINKGAEIKNTKTIDQFATPNNGTIMAWCPNIYEHEFQDFLSHEIEQVREAIEDQGYTYNVNNVFTDSTYNDHDYGTCTYENLTSLANAGLLYIASHGYDGLLDPNTGEVIPKGIALIFSDTFEAINQWRENDPNIIAHQYYYHLWEDECWAAVGTEAWAEQWLSSGLEQNNAISILSTCHSYSSGWVDACTGGICFGYGQNTNYWNSIVHHNYELLNRMNGTIKCPTTNKPIYREAHDAYENMPFHYDEFTYSSNNFIRLCPAIESLSPYNQEYIQTDRTSGLITIDTWCIVDNAHRAEDALTFTTSEGIVITDVYWVMEEGNTNKSRKIEYHWAYNDVESGEIMVTVNPEFIVAHGGGNQQLDFDGTTPNGDQGNFKFYIEANFSCGISVLPSTLVNLANQGENELIFEANCNDEVMHYQWFFEGGTPSTSNLANPVVTYNNEGLFDVNLTITGTNNQSFIITNQDYIYVHDGNDTENDIVSCDYSIIGDKQVSYYLYVDYVTEGETYDVTLYFGDGYHSSTFTVDYPTTIGPIYRTYDDYGVYNSYVTISYQGETEILYLSECGSVQLFDLNPCEDFTVDFDYFPEDPAPNEDILFVPQISNCNGQCYWSWEFSDQASQNYNYNEIIWCNNSTNLNISNNFETEGNFFVKLTVIETEVGCVPKVIEKEIPVRNRTTCYDPIYIYSSHYKLGNPIDRILLKKHPCSLELRWQHTENLTSDCIGTHHPDSAHMYLYKEGSGINDTPNFLRRKSPYSGSPWISFHDYSYFVPIFTEQMSFGKYIFHVFVFGRTNQIHTPFFTAEAKIDVEIVDCDLTAVYIEDGFFEDAVNNAPYYSAGKFILDAEVNSMLNSENTVFTACNGIILTDGFNTGNKSFIATGEGFADCITQSFFWWGWNYALPPQLLNQQEKALSFEVSPNPFREFLYIRIMLPKPSIISLDLFSSDGAFIKNVYNNSVNTDQLELEFSFSELPPGVYLLQLTNEKNTKTLKITKQ